MLVTVTLTVIFLQYLEPINARPTYDGEEMSIKTGNNDYNTLHDILGQNLFGTNEEKAKTVELLLQLLSEIDLPSLCDVIVRDMRDNTNKDFLKVPLKSMKDSEALLTGVTSQTETDFLENVGTQSPEQNLGLRKHESPLYENIVLSTLKTSNVGLNIPMDISYSNNQETQSAQEEGLNNEKQVTVNNKDRRNKLEGNKDFTYNFQQPSINQHFDETKYLALVDMNVDSSFDHQPVLVPQEAESVDNNYKSKVVTESELLYPSLRKHKQSLYNLQLDTSKTTSKQKQKDLLNQQLHWKKTGNTDALVHQDTKRTSIGIERPKSELYANSLLLGTWMKDKNTFYVDSRINAEYNAFKTDNNDERNAYDVSHLIHTEDKESKIKLEKTFADVDTDIDSLINYVDNRNNWLHDKVQIQENTTPTDTNVQKKHAYAEEQEKLPQMYRPDKWSQLAFNIHSSNNKSLSSTVSDNQQETDDIRNLRSMSEADTNTVNVTNDKTSADGISDSIYTDQTHSDTMRTEHSKYINKNIMLKEETRSTPNQLIMPLKHTNLEKYAKKDVPPVTFPDMLKIENTDVMNTGGDATNDSSTTIQTSDLPLLQHSEIKTSNNGHTPQYDEHSASYVRNIVQNGEQGEMFNDNREQLGEKTAAVTDNITILGEQAAAVTDNITIYDEQTAAVTDNITIYGEQTAAVTDNITIYGEQTAAVTDNITIYDEQAFATNASTTQYDEHTVTINNNFTLDYEHDVTTNVNTKQYDKQAYTVPTGTTQLDAEIVTANLDTTQFDEQTDTVPTGTTHLDEQADTVPTGTTHLDEQADTVPTGTTQLDAEIVTANLNTTQFDEQADTANVNSTQYDTQADTVPVGTTQLDEQVVTDNVNTTQYDKQVDRVPTGTTHLNEQAVTVYGSVETHDKQEIPVHIIKAPLENPWINHLNVATLTTSYQYIDMNSDNTIYKNGIDLSTPVNKVTQKSVDLSRPEITQIKEDIPAFNINGSTEQQAILSTIREETYNNQNNVDNILVTPTTHVAANNDVTNVLSTPIVFLDRQTEDLQDSNLDPLISHSIHNSYGISVMNLINETMQERSKIDDSADAFYRLQNTEAVTESIIDDIKSIFPNPSPNSLTSTDTLQIITNYFKDGHLISDAKIDIYKVNLNTKDNEHNISNKSQALPENYSNFESDVPRGNSFQGVSTVATSTSVDSVFENISLATETNNRNLEDNEADNINNDSVDHVTIISHVNNASLPTNLQEMNSWNPVTFTDPNVGSTINDPASPTTHPENNHLPVSTTNGGNSSTKSHLPVGTTNDGNINSTNSHSSVSTTNGGNISSTKSHLPTSTSNGGNISSTKSQHINISLAVSHNVSNIPVGHILFQANSDAVTHQTMPVISHVTNIHEQLIQNNSMTILTVPFEQNVKQFSDDSTRPIIDMISSSTHSEFPLHHPAVNQTSNTSDALQEPDDHNITLPLSIPSQTTTDSYQIKSSDISSSSGATMKHLISAQSSSLTFVPIEGTKQPLRFADFIQPVLADTNKPELPSATITVDSSTETNVGQDLVITSKDDLQPDALPYTKAESKIKNIRLQKIKTLEEVDLTVPSFTQSTINDISEDIKQYDIHDNFTANINSKEPVAFRTQSLGDSLLTPMSNGNVTLDSLKIVSSILTNTKANLSEVNLGFLNKFKRTRQQEYKTHSNGSIVGAELKSSSGDILLQHIEQSKFVPETIKHNTFSFENEDRIRGIITYKNVRRNTTHLNQTITPQEKLNESFTIEYSSYNTESISTAPVLRVTNPTPTTHPLMVSSDATESTIEDSSNNTTEIFISSIMDISIKDSKTTASSIVDQSNKDDETSNIMDFSNKDIEISTQNIMHFSNKDAQTSTQNIMHFSNKDIEISTQNIMNFSNKDIEISTQNIMDFSNKDAQTSTQNIMDFSNKDIEISTQNIMDFSNKDIEISTQNIMDFSNKDAQTSTQNIMDFSNKDAQTSTQNIMHFSNKDIEISAQNIMDFSNKDIEISTQNIMDFSNKDAQTSTQNIMDFSNKDAQTSTQNIMHFSNKDIEISTQNIMDFSNKDIEISAQNIMDFSNKNNEIPTFSTTDLSNEDIETSTSRIIDISSKESPISTFSTMDVSNKKSQTSTFSTMDISNNKSETSTFSTMDVSNKKSETSTFSTMDVSNKKSPTSTFSTMDVSNKKSETSTFSTMDVSNKKSPTSTFSTMDVSNKKSETSTFSTMNLSNKENPTSTISTMNLSNKKSPTSTISTMNLFNKENPTSTISTMNLSNKENPTSTISTMNLSNKKSPTSTISTMNPSSLDTNIYKLSKTHLSKKDSEMSASSAIAMSNGREVTPTDIIYTLETSTGSTLNFRDNSFAGFINEKIGQVNSEDTNKYILHNNKRKVTDMRSSTHTYDVLNVGNKLIAQNVEDTYTSKPELRPYKSGFSDVVEPDSVQQKSTAFIHPWKAYNIALGKHKVKQYRNTPFTKSFAPDVPMFIDSESAPIQQETLIDNYLWKARPWTERISYEQLQNSLDNRMASEQSGRLQTSDLELRNPLNYQTKFINKLYTLNNPDKKIINDIRRDNHFNHNEYDLDVYDQKVLTMPVNLTSYATSHTRDVVNFAAAANSRENVETPIVNNNKQTNSYHIQEYQKEITPDQNDYTEYKDMIKDNNVYYDDDENDQDKMRSDPHSILYTGWLNNSLRKKGAENQVDDENLTGGMNAIPNTLPTSSPTISATKDYKCPDLFGYHKDPDNCQAFFVCSWGMPHRVVCPPGTLYNPKLAVCDWAVNVQCLNAADQTSMLY